MELEVISRNPRRLDGHPPLLLVHGAWHAAWCWKGNFLDYFADRGSQVHALSLRGHGKSEGKENLRWWSIADYVADVHQVAQSLDRPPILVGHSMGGFVTQKYLETHTAPGAVLLASAPPSGIFRFYLRLLRRHPLVWLAVNLRMKTYAVVKKPEYAREWFLAPDVSANDLASYHAKLEDESFRASLDMLMLDLPRPRAGAARIAVLGGGADAVFPPSEIHRTARAYGVDATIFPGMPHAMNLVPRWEVVAEWIWRWARGGDR